MPDDRSLDRESALELAGAALASASTIDGIGMIVTSAVRDLIGQRSGREALFAVLRDDELTVVATFPGELPPSSELGNLVPRWLPRLRLLKSARPKLIPEAGPGPEDKAAALRAGSEGLLLCPLLLTSRPSGDVLIGVLAALGEHRLLSDISSAMGILANQVALALERVLLSEQVVRQRGEALFRTLVQDALDVILVLDDDGTIKYASPSATRLYGDIPIEGANAGFLVAGSEQVVPHAVFDPATSGDVYSGLYRIIRHDGRRVLVEVRFTDLRHNQTVQGQVLTVRDVTGEHQLEDRLKHQALHDALTGLPNRALFTDRAEHALAVAQRNRTIAAVLFVDLDNFKVVNDTMGHPAGDELLAQVARRLAAAARGPNTAARLGGDEFGLLIENLPDAGEAEAFADRVIAAFSERFELSAGAVLAGATVGVASTADSSDVSELLQHADLALYAAKSDCKRRWHCYEPALSAGMARRRELQEALQDALARSALTLAYQPVVDLATGAVEGLTARVRWPRQVRGAAPPGELISLAEETGLIGPLGSWTLRQAITDMARCRGTGSQQPHVSVSVSTRQFRDPGFSEGLRRCLHETGLVPSAVLLELTGSSLLRDQRIACDLAGLKDLGVRLATDNFGTGYSSPSQLRDVPIDALKIGKSFTGAITEPQGRKLAELIIGFAHAIGAEVIAEGIETEEQRALLTEMGCELGQGHLLADPMDWRGAEGLLRSGQPLFSGKA